MARQQIPPRIRWAVDTMDIQPDDHVLEIGCGPGAGAEAIHVWPKDLAARRRRAIRQALRGMRCS